MIQAYYKKTMPKGDKVPHNARWGVSTTTSPAYQDYMRAEKLKREKQRKS
jgi:hypothetical protein